MPFGVQRTCGQISRGIEFFSETQQSISETDFGKQDFVIASKDPSAFIVGTRAGTQSLLLEFKP